MANTPPTDKPEFVLFMMQQDPFCANFISKLKTKPDLVKKINIVKAAIDSIKIINLS